MLGAAAAAMAGGSQGATPLHYLVEALSSSSSSGGGGGGGGTPPPPPVSPILAKRVVEMATAIIRCGGRPTVRNVAGQSAADLLAASTSGAALVAAAASNSRDLSRELVSARDRFAQAAAVFARRRPPPDDAGWAHRTQPHPLRSVSAEDACWIPDAMSAACLCCGEAFSFTNRRHHCRLCGTLVCGYCSSKAFSLIVPPPPAAAGAGGAGGMGGMGGRPPPPTAQTMRVCDGCFNRSCFAVHGAQEAARARRDDLRREREEAEAARRIIEDEHRDGVFGGAANAGGAGGAGGGAQGKGGARGAGASAAGAMSAVRHRHFASAAATAACCRFDSVRFRLLACLFVRAMCVTHGRSGSILLSFLADFS